VASKETAGPNRAFQAALSRAGISNNGLAKRIRHESARRGNPLYTDHGTVGRWLNKGQQPEAETAQLIATILSRELKQAITTSALGFTSTSTATAEAQLVRLDVEYPPDAGAATDGLSTLAGADTDGTAPERLRNWDVHAAPGVITGYLFGDGEPETTAVAQDDAPIDATSIRLTTAKLMELDFQLGGGHTRELLLPYFRSQVLPLFSALPQGAGRRDLFVATAELAQMLGWSAYDAGRHGAAQRYFVHALRLAREADDNLLGARLLANLSHQANYLGAFAHAVQLARAAQAAATGRGRSSQTTLAMLLAMEARALASLGDGAGSAGALARAELAMDRNNPGDDPEWIGYFDRAELAGEAAHCFRDLRRPTEASEFSALALPTDCPPRTRAFINVVNAAAALHSGRLDEAVDGVRNAVALAGSLKSSRYRRYVRDFVAAAVDLHGRDVRVVELLAVTASVVSNTGAIAEHDPPPPARHDLANL
jgi:tetratricopeptide (TPR) repeat protein